VLAASAFDLRADCYVLSMLAVALRTSNFWYKGAFICQWGVAVLDDTTAVDMSRNRVVA